jgi:hypothetical protein
MASPKTKGRMINRDISDSKGFAKLSPQAAVLFTMMIPHYSPYGKMNGDPGYLKGEICPRVEYLTTKNIPACMKEITEHTSVKWFEHDGRWWIHSTNFLTEHQNIRMEKLSPDLLPDYSGTCPVQVPPEVEVEGEVEGEGNEVPAAPVTDQDYILNVKTSFNAMMDDPEQTAEWRSFYGTTLDVDRLLFAACTWLVENPRNRKSKPKRFYGNWLRRAFQDKKGNANA